MALRISTKSAMAPAIGKLRNRPKREVGLRLPSLSGHPGLERVTERDVQRDVLRFCRMALPPGSRVLGIPNQRSQRTDEEAERNMLRALVADGMIIGASDLVPIWDARLGAPGNRGVAWLEVKRPVKPAPVTKAQLEFMEAMRALGFVAGCVQSIEHAEALLIEAGAPLRVRSLGKVSA